MKEIEARREAILFEIKQIRSMRRGSVVEQYFNAKKKGEIQPKIQGPYWLYTFKKKGKTIGKRLKQEEVEIYKTEVDNYHRFQALCEEYAGLTEQLGNQAYNPNNVEEEKKTSKLPTKKRQK